MTTASATSAQSAASTQSSPSNSSALTSLTDNFSNFLGLLMTQLQNQDPSSPMDTNQFTSQLVQFASVEQQINTNTSLTKLIEATQSGTLMQAASLVGDTAQVTSDQLTLQEGKAQIVFTTPPTQPVTLAVTDASGKVLKSETVASGASGWSWDGSTAKGTQAADGAYGITAKAADGTSVAFGVVGTVTGASTGADGVKLTMGGLSTAYGNLTNLTK